VENNNSSNVGNEPLDAENKVRLNKFCLNALCLHPRTLHAIAAGYPNGKMVYPYNTCNCKNFEE
jgi:hypothetical protein